MKRNLLSIGKMAEMNQVTVPTLRLYDQLGLLKPRHVDGETGYRYYDINQNARLDMIAYMKELGMSLKEIQGVLEAEDIALIEQILARKNEQIHQQIRDLRLRHNAVERAIASIERYRKSPATGTIALEYIDRRYIWGISCPENFYEKDISSYEQALTNLRKALLEKNCPQIHSYNTGTFLDRSSSSTNRSWTRTRPVCSSSPTSMRRPTASPPPWSTAACTPVSTWTITMTKLPVPVNCWHFAGITVTASRETTCARCSRSSTCSTGTSAACSCACRCRSIFPEPLDPPVG